MKKTIVILFFALLSSAYAAGIEYAGHSALADGTVVKLRVSESGVYCLTYDQLQSMGLKPDSVRILGYGGAMQSQNFLQPWHDDLPSCTFYMHKGADGVFGKGDYILFWVTGPVDWVSAGSSFTHTRNPYSNYGYCFVSDVAGEQRLIEDNDTEMTDAPAYHEYIGWVPQLHEQDIVNLIDATYGREGGGKEFYGESMSAANPSLKIPFSFPRIDTTANMICRTDVAAASSIPSTFTVRIGNTTRTGMTAEIQSNDYYTKAYAATIRMVNAKADNNSPTVQVTFNNTLSAAKGWLNFVELAAPCFLQADGNTLPYYNLNHYGQDNMTRYHVADPTHDTEVWDITDPTAIYRYRTTRTGDTLVYEASNRQAHRFLLIREAHGSGWNSPDIIGRVENQDIHGLPQTDHIIVSPKSLLPQAKRLAEIHRMYSNETWEVVTDEQVYNEFSSGTPDASAIRHMMKMFYDRAANEDELPKSVLLFGDGSFDNRQLLTTSAKNTLITYQADNSLNEVNAYASDDYFTFLESNDGVSGSTFYDYTARPRLAVGRLPVNTLSEAEGTVSKIATYLENTNAGDWRQQLCFLADDGDHYTHTEAADEAAERVRVNNPDFIVNKIFLDAYPQETSASGERYPLAYNRFTNLLRSGTLLMDYCGHGSSGNICSEMFLTLKDVEAMTNANRGFWMLATCNFAQFDQTHISTAEAAVINPNGGAIAVMSSTRTVYAPQNKALNTLLMDSLFAHNSANQYTMTLGDAVRWAKWRRVNDANRMAYILLGDPTLRLMYPTRYEVTTSDMPDTLTALSHQTVHGCIRDPHTGDTVLFNGTLTVTIYDKMQQITTRDNDEQDASKKRFYTYNDYPNRLFRGTAEVKDGVFEFEFMLPKDIRYNYGEGRIVYYAVGTAEDEGEEIEPAEAVGHNNEVVIGGTSSVVIEDEQGPELTIYLNNTNFKDGGKTDEKPVFYADIYDENGINTVGSGIGHDLLLIVDADTKQTYTVNEYFSSSLGDYTSGTVMYPFSELSEGEHSLTFRAWDLMNNSSTKTLRFRVVKGLDPIIYQGVVYPNPCPASGTLTVLVDHDHLTDPTELCLTFYDLQGHIVYRHTEYNTPTFSLDLGATPLSNGLYVYQLQIRTNTSSYSTKRGKLIVY